MITLNLISQRQKQEIKIKHLHQLLKKIDLTLLIIVCVVAVLILSAKIVLQNTFNRTVEETTLITKNSQGYNNKIRDINIKIASVEQIQKDFLVWTKLFDDLGSIMPRSVRLTYLSAGNDKTIKLRGIAETRDGLLTLKEGLEKSELIDEVNLPLSNILEKENINFEINAKIKTDLLKS